MTHTKTSLLCAAVLVGLAFLFGWMTDVAFWLLEMFPALSRLG